MKRYQSVLFDLCGTVMQYRIDGMPEIEWEGKLVHTTTPLLYACFLEFDRGQISFEAFHAAFTETTEALALKREESGEEILSTLRFEIFLNRLNADLGKRRSEIQRLLKEIHLERVAKCLVLETRHRALLSRWKAAYKIGLVTNFDDTRTVRKILARENLADLFGATLISAEFGLRKPRQEIFLAACEQLGTPPSETLFVGDSWECDILGAQSVGMDTAWINSEQIPQAGPGKKADYLLSDLEALDAILLK